VRRLRVGIAKRFPGGAGLRPGPLRGPARSWLTTVRSTQTLTIASLDGARRGAEEPKRDERIAAGHLRRKRGPACDVKIATTGAPRGARRIQQWMRSHRNCAFRRAIPLHWGQMIKPRTLPRVAARSTHAHSMSCPPKGRLRRPGDEPRRASSNHRRWKIHRRSRGMGILDSRFRGNDKADLTSVSPATTATGRRRETPGS
jgi:hypothetical protein